MNGIISVLIIVMLALYELGAVLALLLHSRPKLANIIPNFLTLCAALSGFGASITFFWSGEARISLGNFVTSVPLISFEISIDRLSALFIMVLSVLTLGVAVYSIGYLSHYYHRHDVGVFNFLMNSFILAMIGVLVAGNMIAFLMSWELMSVISYFLVIFEAEVEGTQKAGTIYLIMTHLTSAFLLIAAGLIYQSSGSFMIDASLSGAPAWIKNVLFGCFLIAFGAKAGMIPLHIWLPYAHPAAPGNVSALMSGMMIKIAIYGLLRFVFGMLGAEFQWWGTFLLVIGIVTTVLGVAYSFVEQNVKRLLAYCSIENIGIILIGVAVSILAYSSGQTAISSLALIAALYHLCNHTIVKGALFLGAGAIQYSTHTKDMESLGGLLKKMPYTGLFMLTGSLAISAIPPFNGFISEWLTYQSIFVNIGTAAIGVKVLLILTVAVLALAGALAAASFTKFFGISFLGLPRTEKAAQAQEVPKTMRLGMGLLAALSLFLGILPSGMIRLLDRVVIGITGETVADTLTGNRFLIYEPIRIGATGITPLEFLMIGLILAGGVVFVVRLLSRQTQDRKYVTWDCGYSGLNARMQYSATGFSKPLRIIFRVLYRPNRDLAVEPGPSAYFPKSLRYEVTTESVFEKYLYLPLVRALTRFAKNFRMIIQTGSIHRYLIYIFVTVLLLLVYFRFCG